jgi:hypothetical protein
MHSSLRLVPALVVASSVVVMLGAQATSPPPAGRPQVNFTRANLQVLPKDVPVRDLVNLMRTFALGLDVRCQYCHVGEGDDLSAVDFASDAKPTKKLAREMMRMTEDLNARIGTLVKTSSDGPRMTCYTCHRGSTKPATIVPEPGRGGGGGR